jgi:hypothetical protein
MGGPSLLTGWGEKNDIFLMIKITSSAPYGNCRFLLTDLEE